MEEVAMVTPWLQARHRVRTRLSEHPRIYLPLARYRHPGPSPEVIGPDTDLVIDGYTRSATTFAVYALQLAQNRPVRLAHHLHAPAQLIQAAQQQVPTLALIREPEGAILSHLVREPWVDMRGAADGYARFYSHLLPWRSSFVVGDFDDVTNDFASVVDRLNERFGLHLQRFEATQANLDLCFELIKERPKLSPVQLSFESGTVSLERLQAERAHSRSVSMAGATLEDSESWVPSPQRSEAKAALRGRWHSDAMTELRRRAEGAYRAFVAQDA
jgi:hypothetical protein